MKLGEWWRKTDTDVGCGVGIFFASNPAIITIANHLTKLKMLIKNKWDTTIDKQ